MTTVKIGTFEIVSERAYISDPCYSGDTWCQGIVERVKNGSWLASILITNEDRVARLLAFTGSVSNAADGRRWQQLRAEIGVDSGQCGIFDAAHYKDAASVKAVARIGPEIICPEDPWYSICCDRTLNTPVGAGVIPYGCVSSSGYGDGSYRAYVTQDSKGHVVGMKITFISLRDEPE